MRKALDDDEFEPIRQAADAANWKEYVKLQGGMCIGRDANFKTHYEETPQGNDYAELVKRIKGVYRSLNNNQLITRLVEWTRQLKGTAEKTAVKNNSNVGAADLSWTSGNNCTPIATGSRDELLLDMVGYDKKEIEQVKKDLISGKRIRRNEQIYQIRDGQLQVLDEAGQQKHEKRLAIEYRAKTLAQKSGSWHVSDEHRKQAQELIELAYTYAEHDGRDSLIETRNENGLVVIGDWDLALLVNDEQASAVSESDWWSLELLA